MERGRTSPQSILKVRPEDDRSAAHLEFLALRALALLSTQRTESSVPVDVGMHDALGSVRVAFAAMTALPRTFDPFYVDFLRLSSTAVSFSATSPAIASMSGLSARSTMIWGLTMSTTVLVSALRTTTLQGSSRPMVGSA